MEALMSALILLSSFLYSDATCSLSHDNCHGLSKANPGPRSGRRLATYLRHKHSSCLPVL